MSMVTLGVADVDRATRYYHALGWDRSSMSVDGTVSFMRGGTVVLGLFGVDDLADDAAVDLTTGGYAPVALATNLGSRAEVDTALATAVQAGGRITKPAEETDWGGYSGYVADPDGHLWEVAHNPFVPLTDSGQMVLVDD